MVGGNSSLLRGRRSCFSGEQGHENSCSCSKVRSVVVWLAQRRSSGALSLAGVGCAKGSWLTFQLEEKTFLQALGSIISTSSL